MHTVIIETFTYKKTKFNHQIGAVFHSVDTELLSILAFLVSAGRPLSPCLRSSAPFSLPSFIFDQLVLKDLLKDKKRWKVKRNLTVKIVLEMSADMRPGRHNETVKSLDNQAYEEPPD